METQYIKVGKIVNTFGIRGEIKIYLYTDFPEQRFQKNQQLYVGKEEKPNEYRFTVEKAKPYKNVYLLKFKEFDNINQVEKYRDYYLWITKEEQGDLAEGEYYYHQIIGCQVVTTGGEEIGIVTGILRPGANDVWIVKAKTEKKEFLIPYIKDVIKVVDVKNKKIVIEVMEGLLS
ncbi:ribosome maturation factor RimM [Tepidibacillus fermentans]|uniref:Ribosome maturation factor RimM n=1 Tax=Tepidibacillus fermentans TaxID=1281767 RepID=A0A4V2URX4_9BACI|nr:ribosome maturation factor RimM [Tepidibacillus fermentans]TCS79212.1 16S rRNA processing protein RimM [Tepidibacillus fermentans]